MVSGFLEVRDQSSELSQGGGTADHSLLEWTGTTVYDITDWIESHPGGSVILRAAGGALEPYWSVFSFHTRPDILEMLDEFQIGEVRTASALEVSNAHAVSATRR